MNPLADKPDLRKKVYTAFWMIGLALGAMSAYFGASAADDEPDWLVPATAAYAFVGVGVGYTASQNTPQRGEGG